MLDVICWKWAPMVKGYRSSFGARQVNVLRRMVARHYAAPHRFTCVTDDARGVDPDIRILAVPDEFGALRSPHGPHQPHCYRRVSAWGPWGEENFGERFVSLDLDTVITGDLGPLWDRPEECVMWQDALSPNPYNGSMWLLKNGSRRAVYESLVNYVGLGHDPGATTRAGGFFGSDQAWYAFCLTKSGAPPLAATWNRTDGVYSWRVHMAPWTFGGTREPVTRSDIERMRRGAAPPPARSKHDGQLPADARIVFFHGLYDPWNPQLMERFEWIRKNYK